MRDEKVSSSPAGGVGATSWESRKRERLRRNFVGLGEEAAHWCERGGQPPSSPQIKALEEFPLSSGFLRAGEKERFRKFRRKRPAFYRLFGRGDLSTKASKVVPLTI